LKFSSIACSGVVLEFYAAVADRDEFFTIELAERLADVFVHGIGEIDDFEAAGLKGFHIRAALHPVSRRRSCLRLLSRSSFRDDSDFHGLISCMCAHASGVSVTVAANEPPKSFALLIRYDTHRGAATSPSLAQPEHDYKSARTCSKCSSGFTFGRTALIFPSGSRRFHQFKI